MRSKNGEEMNDLSVKIHRSVESAMLQIFYAIQIVLYLLLRPTETFPFKAGDFAFPGLFYLCLKFLSGATKRQHEKTLPASTEYLGQVLYFFHSGSSLLSLYSILFFNVEALDQSNQLFKSSLALKCLPHVTQLLLCQYMIGALSRLPQGAVVSIHLASVPFLCKLMGMLFGWSSSASAMIAALLAIFHFTFVAHIISKVSSLLPFESNKHTHRTAKVVSADEYAAQTLHDIGTPLATLSMGLDLLNDQPMANVGCCREVLSTMTMAKEMMALIRVRAMDHFRSESGKEFLPKISAIDLHELVFVKCRRIVNGYGGRNNVEFDFFVDPKVSRFVLTDGDWVWDCVINYLSNAEHFTGEGIVQLKVFIENGTEESEFLRFEVWDNGPGVSETHKNMLFKPFVQIGKGVGGTGLGLYGVAKKIGALGGKFGISDNPKSNGSIFWLSVPYLPTETTEGATDEAIAFKQKSNEPLDGNLAKEMDEGEGSEEKVKPSRSILVVEDDSMQRKFLKVMLGKKGYSVDTATNGLEGLSWMKERTYHAVLTDTNMPVMGGYEQVCLKRKWEAENGGKRQFIACVSADSEDSWERAKERGCDAYLSKPVDMRKLVELLEGIDGNVGGT